MFCEQGSFRPGFSPVIYARIELQKTIALCRRARSDLAAAAFNPRKNRSDATCPLAREMRARTCTSRGETKTKRQVAAHKEERF